MLTVFEFMINTAPPASKSVYGREKLFSYDKINFSNYVCACGAVVKELLERADKPGSTPGDAVFCYFVFFSVWSLFLTLFFLLAFFSLFVKMLTLLVIHLDQYIFLSLSAEFYFEKGISKALDLHTGQAYDQKKKTISCQDMSLL